MSHPAQTTPTASWRGDTPLVAAARERLIDAASRCVARDRALDVSVAAIAEEAGVSRQTVYRYFAGRDDLVAAALLAASARLRTTVLNRTAHLTDAADIIVEALVVALTEIPEDPVLRALGDAATRGTLASVSFTDASSIAWTRETLERAIAAAPWPESEIDESLELVLRIFSSLVVSPVPQRSPEELRGLLYRRLIPGLGLDVDDLEPAARGGAR